MKKNKFDRKVEAARRLALANGKREARINARFKKLRDQKSNTWENVRDIAAQVVKNEKWPIGLFQETLRQMGYGESAIINGIFLFPLIRRRQCQILLNA